jgi:hypothetical protein
MLSAKKKKKEEQRRRKKTQRKREEKKGIDQIITVSPVRRRRSLFLPHLSSSRVSRSCLQK